MCMQVESKTMQVSSRVHASEAATFATHRNPTLGLRPPHPRYRLGSSAPLRVSISHPHMKAHTRAPTPCSTFLGVRPQLHASVTTLRAPLQASFLCELCLLLLS
jgi:hypothetical protein